MRSPSDQNARSTPELAHPAGSRRYCPATPMSSSTASSPASDVTRLLHAWGNGDAEARHHLVPLVDAELRRRAAAQLRRERAGDSLQPTALVHEAYLRLVKRTILAGRSGRTFSRLRRFLCDASSWTARAPAGAGQALGPVATDHAAQQRRRTRAGRGRFHRSGPGVDRARGHLAAQEPGGPAPVFRGAVAAGNGRRAGHLARHRRARVAGRARVALRAPHRPAETTSEVIYQNRKMTSEVISLVARGRRLRRGRAAGACTSTVCGGSSAGASATRGTSRSAGTSDVDLGHVRALVHEDGRWRVSG